MSNVIHQKKYLILSSIQTFFILITAISVFDLGYSGHVSKGLYFNHVLFHLEELPKLITDSPFWGEFQFWGYCFFIVAVCQIMKALPIETYNYHRISELSGLSSIVIILTSIITAIIVSLPEYSITSETLSSLVDHGWLPTILISWGLMLGAIFAMPFFLYSKRNIYPVQINYIAASIACISCLMLFATGLTLPSDEPYDHGQFAYAFFLTMAYAISLYSTGIIPKSSYEKILMIIGLIMFPLLVFLILFSPSSLLAILQKSLGIIFLGWLIWFGIVSNETV